MFGSKARTTMYDDNLGMSELDARITIHDDRLELISCGRRPEGFAKALKSLVPSASRRYVPARGAWVVEWEYAEEMMGLVGRCWPNYELFEAGYEPDPNYPNYARATGGQSALDVAYTILRLLPSAPAELAEAAYRTLVTMIHPDLLPPEQHAAGKEHRKALNAAIAIIRRARAQQVRT